MNAFFSHPSRVAAALQLTGALGIAIVLPLRHWSNTTLIFLIVAVGIAVTIAGVRITIGDRLPRWTLQVDVGIGTMVVTLVTAASVREHIDLANLYLLVVLFAVLYLPVRTALMHGATAGVAYAVLLGFEPAPVEPSVVAWLGVFGTAAALGTVLLGLVRVLRVTARRDPLTGLANRRMWDERLGEELERARRSGESLSIVIADLDGLKEVNDGSGHDVGDRVLRAVADAWRAVIRGSDLLARLGGDEFGLLAPSSNEARVRLLVERLTDSLPTGTSASLGVATWDGIESASDLLRRADRAMYQSKRRHRRRAQLHEV